LSATSLSLNLLGRPTLVAPDGPVALSPSATMLCAYLALAPREGRSRSVAAAHLFADCVESTGRRRLNTALWRLRTEVRSTTGVEIVATAEARRIAFSNTVELTVDASVFERLVTPVLRLRPEELGEPHARRLRAAVALHRGRLVEPCQEEWVLGERNRIENLYLTALDYLLQYDGAHGRVGDAARYGELALELEPLREDLHRHLMQVYGGAGRDDLVERQYERCRSVLLQELGTDPMPETLAARYRYRRGETSTVADVDALISELERARRDVDRLAQSVDRALGQQR
jgi:DNA-binding SARP family transcriptional activator